MHFKSKNKKQTGFTLLELLVVIAIIGLLSSIVLVSVNSARQKARIAAGMTFSNNLRSGLADSLISHWSFDKNSGSTAYDNWGDNDGTINGATWDSDGIKRSALSFDGNDDYVDLPNSISTPIENIITVEAWVYSNSLSVDSSYRGIITEKYTADGNVEFELFLNGVDHNLSAGFYDGVWNQISETTAFPIGQWVHTAATYDGNYIKIYKNGVQVAISSDLNKALPSGTGGWRIGRRHDGGGASDMWNGLIDEVKIYSEALTVGQIQQHYVESAPRHGIVLK